MTGNTEIDPAFCSLCQDALPAGKMLVVLAGTQEVLFDTEFGACMRCGHTYTDVTICENSEDGRVGVFQFEHEQFATAEVQAEIPRLVAEVETLVCVVCGKPVIEADDSEVVFSPRDFAVKMLRLSPESASLVAACGSCTEAGLCPCCNDDDDDETD